MELNRELIRELLIYIEENSDGRTPIRTIALDGYTENEIDYHLELLLDEEYIIGKKIKIMNKGDVVIPVRLTMKGHSYIENIRDKYIWNEIKKEIEIKGFKRVSLDILKDYANKVVREKLDM